MDLSNFVGKVVSFGVYPTAILGNTIQRVLVVGLVEYDLAKNLGSAAELHAAVYPTLPSSVPNDPAGYQWLVYRDASDKTNIIGVPWIKDDTVVEAGEYFNVNVTIPLATTADVQRLRELLAANNFQNVKINMV